LAASAGAVASVFSRTGVVVAVSGDYDSDQVDNVSTVTGVSVSDALDTLNTPIDLTGARVATGPANSFLKGTGAGNVWATLFTTPANPGDNGKVVLASAGDFSFLGGGATGNALIWNGAAWAAGTDFGAQNLTTTAGFMGKSTAAFLRLGLVAGSGAGVASSAATGQIRGSRGASGFAIRVRNQADTADLPTLLTDTISAEPLLTIGGTGAGGFTVLIASPASGTVVLRAGASTSQLSVSTSGVFLNNAVLGFTTGISPVIQQLSDATNGVTGTKLTMRAQNCIGTTSTGGSLDLGPGAGTTQSVLGRLITGLVTTQMFAWNDTGIGFYATAPVAKPTISGSRASGAALADLLTKVAAQGLFVDGTSA
jgi:hypothetical protein